MEQQDLATSCNLLGFDISRAGISKIEMGIRQVTDLEVALIAMALEVSILDLFPENRELPLWQPRKTWPEEE
jgi:transcriptional regulator with XRE-family HTH domain